MNFTPNKTPVEIFKIFILVLMANGIEIVGKNLIF